MVHLLRSSRLLRREDRVLRLRQPERKSDIRSSSCFRVGPRNLRARPRVVATTLQCAASGSCDGLTMTPVDYSPKPVLVYRVSTPAADVAALNEAYYRGWTARVCDAKAPADCRAALVRGGAAGEVLVDIPAGDWLLTLRYHQPGLALAWWLFAAGCAMIAAWSGAL